VFDIMPTKSSFEDVEIPAVDLWGFMFDQKKDFAEDQGGNLISARVV